MAEAVRWCLIVGLCLWLAPRPALAANTHLRNARALQARLNFREAVAELELARRSPADRGELLEILDLLGQCNMAEGRRADAQSAYEAMLTLDPHVRLDEALSPKIVAVFEAAKAKLFPKDHVRLSVSSSQAQAIQVAVVDPWRRAAEVLVLWQVEGEASWSSAPLAVENHEAVLVPPDRGRSYLWYLEARGADGNVLARLGSASAPRSLTASQGALERPAPAPPPPAAVKPEPALAARVNPLRWPALAALVVGAGLGALSGALFFEANRVYQRFLSSAPLDQPAEAYRDQGKTLQSGALGAALTAGGAVVIAVVLYVVGARGWGGPPPAAEGQAR